eukprot:4060104-Alexandrium_andersonii.AAC.1
MRNCPRLSKLVLRGPRNGLELQPREASSGGSAPFDALHPMVATKQAGRRARSRATGTQQHARQQQQ